MLLFLLPPALASPTCLQAVSDTGGALVPPTGAARVVVELRLTESSAPERVAGTIESIDRAGIPLTVLIPTGWTPSHPDQLSGSRVEIGLRTSIPELLPQTPDQPDAIPVRDWQLALRSARRELRQHTGASARTVSLPPPPPSLELVLDDVGMKTILLEDPSSTAAPRVARSWGGQPGRARLLSEQGYGDGCGALLRTGSSASMNRIARAGPTVPVLRVVLPPDPELAAVFSSWWSTVAHPAQWEATTPRQAGVRSAGAWLPRPPADVQAPPASSPVRSLSAAELDAAAQAIADARRLPRTLPGDLNLTEAFLGLLAWAAHPQERVELVPAKGPTNLPASSTRPTGPVDSDDLTSSAQTLASALGTTLPSLVTVGSETLTIREYLVALAHLKLSQPLIARDTPDPDPYAPDGGWGSSAPR